MTQSFIPDRMNSMNGFVATRNLHLNDVLIGDFSVHDPSLATKVTDVDLIEKKQAENAKRP